jgi:hypothetical protein
MQLTKNLKTVFAVSLACRTTLGSALPTSAATGLSGTRPAFSPKPVEPVRFCQLKPPCNSVVYCNSLWSGCCRQWVCISR